MTDTEKNASMVCPKCGANLEIEAYNDNFDQIVCPYCDYKRIEPKKSLLQSRWTMKKRLFMQKKKDTYVQMMRLKKLRKHVHVRELR